MKTLEIQIPAEGILQTNNWGDSKVYKVVCNCGQEDHSHNVWVECDDHDVNVTIYTTVKTNFWSKKRWQHIWVLLTKGYVDFESTVCMTQQQAFNYSHTLLSAIDDVKKFKQDRKEKSATAKLAEQGDCA
jgi:hypothetical protein